MINVNSIIDNLASKFGTTAPYLIEEMQKYYIVNEAMWMVICLVIVIISAIISKKLVSKGLAIKKEDEFGDWEMPFVFGCSTYAVTIGFGIGFIVAIKDLIQWYVSPTASVISIIVSVLSR